MISQTCANLEMSRFDSIESMEIEDFSTNGLPKQCGLWEFIGKEIRYLGGHPTQDAWRIDSFQKLVSLIPSEAKRDWNFRVLINMDDDVPVDSEGAPSLCFSRRPGQRNNILVPDPHVFNLSHVCSTIPEFDKPTSTKRPEAVFAGSDTGLYKDEYNNQRISFCKKYAGSDLGKFKITQFVETDCAPTTKQLIGGQFIPIEEQLQYRYIVNINGNTTAWDRLLWAMSSNSVCIWVKPEVPQMSWYYIWWELMGFNAIPVFEMDGLEATIQWLELAQKYETVKQQQLVCSQPFTDVNTHVAYLYHILNKYNDLYKA